MKLTVNGNEHDAQDVKTVADLVRQMGLADSAVAVEVNRKVVPRKEHGQTSLQDGDVVEMVTLVGGG
jgi:thiamine biosynthesis protein ThiS